MTDTFEFQGFEPSNTTAVPDVFFDELLSELSGAELKALLYIIRRTLGFKKTADSISLNQFEKGITTKDGKVLDKGCGIKDRHTLLKVLKSLENKWHCIESTKPVNEKKECETTQYRIKFRTNGVVGKITLPVQLGSVENTTTPEGKITLPVVGKSTLGVVGKITPTRNSNTIDRLQETVIQEESTIAPDIHTPALQDAIAPAHASLSSQQIPVTYAEALDYLKAHGPHEGLDASEVMLLARKLYAESQQSQENENHSHLEQEEVTPAITPPTMVGGITQEKPPRAARTAKAKETPVLSAEEQALDDRRRQWQEKINENRGGPLRLKGECINETNCLKQLVQEFNDKQIAAILAHMQTEMFPYCKNPHKIGGADMLKESRPVAQLLKDRREQAQQGKPPTPIVSRPQGNKLGAPANWNVPKSAVGVK